MRLANTARFVFTMAITISAGSTALAQCQGRGQTAGTTSAASTASLTPYTQNALTSGYNQDGLNPLAYNQQFLSPTQTFEYKRALLAMQVQSQSLALRNQVAQAQSAARQMKKDSMAMRKAAAQERAENLALREERESAKRMKNYESQRGTNRVASVQ